MENSDYKRLARAEAMANYQRSQLLEVLRAAYEAACASGDEQAAADAARMFRNKLLDLSDKEVSFDKLDTNIENNMPFIDLNNTSIIEWIVYRQLLRDISQQKGFPFDITFPHYPNEKETL